MNQDIVTLLDSYNVTALRSIVLAAGLEDTTQRGRKLLKVELRKLIINEVFSAERVKRAYDQLTDVERNVVDRLLLKNQPMPTALLKRQLLRAGSVKAAPRKQSRYGRETAYVGRDFPRNSTIFEDVLTRLAKFGLVFSDPTLIANKRSQRFSLSPSAALIIPDVVRRHLPPPTQINDKLTNWQPEKIVSGDPLLLVRDLYLYWEYVRRERVSLIKSGLVGKRSLKAVNAALLVQEDVNAVRSESELPRLLFLRRVLQMHRLLQVQDGELIANFQPDFWNVSTEKLVGNVLRTWSQQSDLLGLDAARQFATIPTRACAELLVLLSKQSADAWLSITTVAEQLQETNTNVYFLHRSDVEKSRSQVYTFDGVYFNGGTEAVLSRLDQLELAFVKRCINTVLQPAGIVDVGYDKNLEAIRLTEFGRAALLDQPLQAQPEEGRIIVQPTFQLLALGAIPIATMVQIDQFAERVKIDRNVFEYRLTRDSVYAAQQAGFSADAITNFLEKESGMSLPQNVRRSFSEWGARHERIVFRSSITLLQTKNAAQLETLQNSVQTGATIASLLTPTLAILKPNTQPALRDALFAQGLLPTTDRADTTDNSLSIDKAGRVTLRQTTPSLFIIGQLEQIAERGDKDAWRITRAAFERSAKNKEETLRYLAELERLQIGELPAELIRQIKIWGNFYGQVAIETLTLVAFQDQETLRDLAQHSALKGLLRPFPNVSRPLAIIAADALPQVRGYLQELGIDIVEGIIG